MQLTRNESLLLRLLYVFTAGIIMLQVLGNDALTSAFFSMTFLLVAAMWLMSAYREVSNVDLLALGLILLCFIHVFLNSWTAESSLSFGYLKKWILFSTSVLFLSMSSKLIASAEDIRFFCRVNDFLALYFIAAFFLLGDRMYLMNHQVTRYLTFHFSNPNLTGLFLACIGMIETIQCFDRQKGKRIGFHALLLAFVAFFIYKTESRSALLALLAMAGISSFRVLRKRERNAMPVWVVLLVVLLPLLFVRLYLLIVHTAWLNHALSFMIQEGKGLDSRVKIWTFALDWYHRSPILGAYSQISGGKGMSQMHNSHLDVLASYGTVPLLLMCIWLTLVIQKKNIRCKTAMYLLAFIGVLLLGVGEAALFSGSLGIYVFAGSFLLFSDLTEENRTCESC